MKLETLHEVKYVGGRTLDKLLHFFDEHDMDGRDDFGSEMTTYYVRDGFMVKNTDEHTKNEIRSIRVDKHDESHITVEYVDGNAFTYNTHQMLPHIEVYNIKRVF